MADRRDLSRPHARGAPGRTVLIVDYEPRTVETLSTVLTAAGYRVVVAKDGPAGVDAFIEHSPAVTLIECMLPRKSGLDVCAELRALPNGTDTPIILMSSKFRGRQYRADARHRYLANEFLDKPVEAAALLTAVDALAGVDRAMAALQEEHEVREVPAPAATSEPACAMDDWQRELDLHIDSILGK